MGGLSKRMPITFITFLVATLALTGCPFFSGFYSKDAILLAARSHDRIIFSLALTTAFLTAFYMFRLFTVVFLGRSRSDAANHGHEVPPVMAAPLAILAVPSVIAGYSWFAGRFLTLPHHEGHNVIVPAFAVAMFALGAAMAFLIYNNKAADPFHIPLFANKFYIDEIYAGIIRWTQDLLAAISGWLDRWILDGVIVRGVSGGAWVSGFVLRFLQMGNLQGYAFIFGIGTVALIYYILLGK
jgi:NADH-quinone oxidoreductase subunit L